MISWFYFITFAASLVMIMNFMRRNKRIDTLYVVFGMMITFNTMGRWLVSISETVQQAIWGTKLLYIGACYIPLILILVLARLCSLEISRRLTIPFFSFAAIVMGLVMTVGHSGIYYKSVTLCQGNGYMYLEKEYGPAHALYTVLTVLDIILIMYFIIYAARNREKIPMKTVVSIGGLGVVILAAYLVSKIFSSSFEWFSVGGLAAVIAISRRFEQINMYDMAANIATSVENMKEYGFIVFDSKGNFINANQFIKSYFPEINDWKTEMPVKDTSTAAYEKIVSSYMELRDGGEGSKTVHHNDKYFDISVRDITFRDKKVGDLVEIADRTAEHDYTVKVEEYNTTLSAEVEIKTAHINAIRDKMVIGMAAMVESRDDSTGGHIQRTSDVVRLFAGRLSQHSRELGIDEKFIGMVIRSAPMHDLGKIAVDDRILKKRGRFTEEEYAQMKQHSAEGAKIVRKILHGIEDESFIGIAENVAHYHHEKWNGQGYPCGLSGEDIPIEARIMALADVFDALVSKRCYKEAYDYDTAFEIIRKDMGSHFDPVLGKLFLECKSELMTMYDGIRAAEQVSAE